MDNSSQKIVEAFNVHMGALKLRASYLDRYRYKNQKGAKIPPPMLSSIGLCRNKFMDVYQKKKSTNPGQFRKNFTDTHCDVYDLVWGAIKDIGLIMAH